MIPKAVKDKIHSLLKDYNGKEIPDSKVHAIAEEGGISPHDLESYIYSLASKHVTEKAAEWKDKLPGGLADKKKPSDFDPKALAKGKKVEMEHTDDPQKAEEIAMDHLTEDSAYYDKLETIEKHGSLRQAVIKLAHANPELRKHLIPILRAAADKAKTEEGAKKLYEKYKEKHPNTTKKPQDFYEAPKDDEKPKDEKKPEDEKKPDDSDDEKKDDSDAGDDDEYDVSTESFKKDFDPKDFNGFDGWVGVRFPNEAAEDVSQPGDAEEAVKHWVKELGWNVPADEARQYLTEAGVEEERVEEMDEDDLNEYTFWLAAGQQHENDYEDGRLASLRRATIKLAHDVPEMRKHLVPILRRTAAGCGDEQMAGRLWKGEPGKGYGMTGPDVRGPGKWTPEAKGKCYYETGDEADRCYVTELGGPGGQTKPKTRGDKDYEKKRWPKGRPR